MTKGYADIPDGQISYKTEGSGPPVVLLHQTPMSYEEYSLMIPILAKEYRVIAMENPGYGYSDTPPREYDIEDYARSVISFLDALNIGKASIVGHHTGSVIAAEVAAAYPERVDKLIVSGLPYWDAEKWEEFFSDMESQTKPPADDGLFLVDLWNLIRVYAPHMKPESLIKPTALFLDGFTRTYDAHHAVARYDIKQRLPLIASPTLVISGREDVFIDDLEILKEVIPQCTTQVIDGTGALICLEKPNEFAQTIIEFLKT